MSACVDSTGLVDDTWDVTRVCLDLCVIVWVVSVGVCRLGCVWVWAYNNQRPRTGWRGSVIIRQGLGGDGVSGPVSQVVSRDGRETDLYIRVLGVDRLVPWDSGAETTNRVPW